MTSSHGAFQQAMSAAGPSLGYTAASGPPGQPAASAGPSVVHPTADNPFRIPGSSPLTPPTFPTPMDDVGNRHGSGAKLWYPERVGHLP